MPLPVAVASGLMSLGSTLIDRVLPDPAARDAAKLELLKLESSGELSRLSEAASIIRAEASSESWLARNWRPLVMVTFTALIVARWLGWAAPSLQPEEYLVLWNIVEFGLGGYVVGRTGEKIAKTVAEAYVSKSQ